MNFIIQAKNVKGELSKSAGKTAKLMQKLVLALPYAVSTEILLLCNVNSTFLLFVVLFAISAV